ncbi:energy transducer TonB [Aurantiacibacter marinus]|uniref:energy transducer TonB n=1 Tax=Aurantiacibacter marinus TaxID=874156 RepID=UPI00069AEB9C|nr:energy transducer TonB [Aurantiacibacter marinus]
MKNSLWAVLPSHIFLVLALSNPVSAQEDALVLPAASPWNVDMAAESCGLRRIFGTEEQSVFLEMRQFAPGGYVRFTVYSNELRSGSEEMRYTLHPDTDVLYSTSPYTLTTADGGQGASFGGSIYQTEANTSGEGNYDGFGSDDSPAPLTPEEMSDREALINAISITGAFEQPVSLQSGSLGAPMQVMRGCLDDLVASWGIDLEAHRTLSRPVQPRGYRRWVQRIVEDYPSAALQRSEQAALQVRLIVNLEGRVEECVAQSEVGDPVFVETACRSLTRNARFDPALDAEGNPIKSYWTTSILYALN